MIRRKHILWHAWLIFFVAACNGFALDAHEQFIQGKWGQGGTNDGYAWYSTYTFTRGAFTIEGYPPVHQTGNYRSVSSVGETLVLELYNQKGDLGITSTKITILLDRTNDRISLDNGLSFYTRSK